MKKTNKFSLKKLCLLVGVALVIAGVALLVFWQWSIHSAVAKNQSYLSAIKASIPTPQGAVLEERGDNTMPVLSVEDKDFVGILEMPSYNLSLPVGAEWGSTTKHPCRFSGSLYDSTIKIGATSGKGQFDVYREISVGDSLIFTDMSGNQYTYTVKALNYEKHADMSTLEKLTSDLTLFIKNNYAFEYLIVSLAAVN